MDAKQVVKNKLLMQKVKEYFAANPGKNQVVVTADLGEGKAFWRADLKENKLHVTEVMTSTKEFVLEASTDPGSVKGFTSQAPKKTKHKNLVSPIGSDVNMVKHKPKSVPTVKIP